MPIKVGNGKWHGSVGGILCAPIDKKDAVPWMEMTMNPAMLGLS
ncbi:hypothetical protein glysoja_044419 [Glycine soja]|uniref:Uncharacterized protein n=1 Tax=Glycine soja TaxID=3848 RepID=A0A0B2SUC8_GLYSO|nr:hypothetical protein glysoja_044419 [Glycine soja]